MYIHCLMPADEEDLINPLVHLKRRDVVFAEQQVPLPARRVITGNRETPLTLLRVIKMILKLFIAG